MATTQQIIDSKLPNSQDSTNEPAKERTASNDASDEVAIIEPAPPEIIEIDDTDDADCDDAKTAANKTDQSVANDVSNKDTDSTSDHVIASKCIKDQRKTPSTGCVMCSKGHRTVDCDDFKRFSITKRWTVTRELNLCFGCLRIGHTLEDCRSKDVCPIDGCTRMHHVLLHRGDQNELSNADSDGAVTTMATNSEGGRQSSFDRDDVPDMPLLNYKQCIFERPYKITMSTGHASIVVHYSNPIVCLKNKCNDLMEACRKRNHHLNDSWTRIIVHHSQPETRWNILKPFFDVTNNSAFNPIAFRQLRRPQTKDHFTSIFMVCRALSNLIRFAKCNMILGETEKERQRTIIVAVNVARLVDGQVGVRDCLTQALARRAQLIKKGPLARVFELSALENDPTMAEIFVHFGKDYALRQLIGLITHMNKHLLHSVRIVRMRNNRLKELLAFRKWPVNMELDVLDLSKNEIDDINQLRAFKNMKIKNLIITDNPLMKMVGVTHIFVKMLPFLQRINGFAIDVQPEPSIRNPASDKITSIASIASSSELPELTDINRMVVREIRLVPTTTLSITALDVLPNPSKQQSEKETTESLSASAVVSPPQTSEPICQSQPTPVVVVPVVTTITWQPPTASDIGPQPLPADQAGDIINADTTITPQAFDRKYKTSTMWHRVVIEHKSDHTKDAILDSLWTALEPLPLYPCYYARHTTHDSFYVRHCFSALYRFVSVRLLLRIRPTSQDCAITLHMNAAWFRPEADHVEPTERIRLVVEKCYRAADRTLDLSKFAAHKELRHIEVCVQNTVIKTAAERHVGNVVHCIRLSDNGLSSSAGLRQLTVFKSLRVLDLSANRFTNVRALASSLPALATVQEFWLQGNPLTADIQPLQYVHELKNFLPNLQRLDGEWLGSTRMAPIQQNYVCQAAGADVVEQFCEQYFEALDNSRVMKHMYGKHAMMSMSCALPKGACGTIEATALLQNYVTGSRNLWRVSSSGAAHQQGVFIGGGAIEQRWKTFELFEHDYGSFTVDMTHWSEEMCVFTVQGLYREWKAKASAADIEQRMFGFVRTFVLKRYKTKMGLFKQSSCYEIVNELVLIYQPSLEQMRVAFAKRPAITLGSADDVDGDAALTAEEMDGLVIVLQEITKMMPQWCRNLLEQSYWQLRSALELFVQMCESDRLPEHAFMVVPLDVA